MMKLRRLHHAAAALAAMLLLAACGAPATPTAPPLGTFEPATATPGASATPGVSAEPSSAATFTPETARPAAKVKIVVSSYFSISPYSGIVNQINNAVQAAGQSVQFTMRNISFPVNGRSDAVEKTKNDLASGKPNADAYAMYATESSELFGQGLTMDVSDLARQSAPAYFAKYHDLFPDTLSGLPVGLNTRPQWQKTALILRDEITPSVDTGTIAGFLQFVNDDIKTSTEGWKIMVQPETLVRQWALEQGYYPLADYGVRGRLYAALNDPKCAPIPLERIDGVQGFLSKITPLYQGGLLVASVPQDGGTMAGMVRRLGDYYYLNPYASMFTLGKDGLTAYPFTPDLPAAFASGSYDAELALPLGLPADKAAAIAGFVEWLYASQDNYDMVLYGQPGVDFEPSPGRFAPMRNGKLDALVSLGTMVYNWPGAEMLGNGDYLRLPINVPANLEKLVAAGLDARLEPPLASLASPGSPVTEKLRHPGDELTAAAQARDALYDALFLDDPAKLSESRVQSTLEQLASLKGDWLAKQYGAIFAGPDAKK